MVLETPSFERPELTWKKEIEVLYRLSDAPEEPDAEMLEQLTKEIKDAVKEAEKANPAKSKAKPKKVVGKRKRGAKADSDEEGEEEEEED